MGCMKEIVIYIFAAGNFIDLQANDSEFEAFIANF